MPQMWIGGGFEASEKNRRAPSDGIFGRSADGGLTLGMSNIDRSMSIVPETGQNLIRRNSPLKSRAQIYDRSPRRFFVVRIKNLPRQINALPSLRMIEWE
jgi:hypothetical protein